MQVLNSSKIEFNRQGTPSTLSMDASILIVGCANFLTTLLEPIRCLTASTVEVASDPTEATPLIQAQQPDLLIMQASQTDCLDLCRMVKAQSRLSWIYCIVVNEQTQGGEIGWNESTQLEIQSLQAGADAYLPLAIDQFDPELWNPELNRLQLQLLQVKIQAGLRRVYNHRELIRTNDLLSAIALSDPLTELNNRRAFEWELPRQIQNARSRDVPISLLMLDVDYFKTINDQHGHLVGDRALQLLAARIRHNLRFYDTPFRYGGEEFVIILSDTGCQEAKAIAHRIRRLIADQLFTIDDTLDLRITISAGAASLLPDDDARGISLLQRADQNLLMAKSMGRNRVISCRDHPHCTDPEL